MIARRNIVIGAAAGLASAGVGAVVLKHDGMAAGAAAQDGGASGLAARFRSLVGKTFTADTTGERLHLRLTRVDELPASQPFEQLTVAFEETSGRGGPESTYSVRQTGGGLGAYRAELFLQPGEGEGQFSAAFNVLKT